VRTENRSVLSNPALAGPIWSFELVRGTGDPEVIRLCWQRSSTVASTYDVAERMVDMHALA
jgi:hypothetical protein